MQHDNAVILLAKQVFQVFQFYSDTLGQPDSVCSQCSMFSSENDTCFMFVL
jgi:hypothetical protein